MPKVVPSLVVQFLDSSGLPLDGALDAQNTPTVAALLELLAEVPEAHFETLALEEHALLVTTRGMLRGAVARWVYVDGPELRNTGGPRLHRHQALGNRYPLAVLRELLSKCPDEAPAEHLSGLEFLNDADLAAVLRQDMTTAHTALSNGEFKAACVMAGSVVEALLLWGLKRRTAADIGLAVQEWRAAPGANVPRQLDPEDLEGREWAFHALLSVARRIAPPLLAARTATLAESMNEFRNLIHPGRAARLSLKPTLGMAHVAVGVMRQAVDELEELVKAGRL